MKRAFSIFFTLLFVVLVSSAQSVKYQYETVSGDPYNAQIYTLSNGLKVYMSVYKDVPRIQTYVVVRVGSKNDPAETTGLAHYLEHLMFKGTSKIGTTDWKSEKPLLEQVEALFEQYRQETDPVQRAEIYHVIDSISYIASGYAIPNEYGKIMKFIGATGTNAWTSNDRTVYVEDIPSNQLENWAMIQGERFREPVIRLFHTELETVYEEKNRALSNDGRRANEAMLAGLFPHHPYGTQTTLGEAEHLKNPSITNIRNFIAKYYVPNNMAICLAGDFDPDEAVAIIERYFGELKPSPIDPRVPASESDAQSGCKIDVVGQEAEFVNIAFPLNLAANDGGIVVAEMLSNVLSNGKCGVIDLNINQKQLAASAYAYPYVLSDNSAFVLTARPNPGQSLEELVDLLEAQLDSVREGRFDPALMEAALNNLRLQEMRQLEKNSSRASKLANAFVNDIPWKTACREMDAYQRVTIDDLRAFVDKYCVLDRAVVVFKRRGRPAGIEPVAKPAITPIQINRDADSKFYNSLTSKEVEKIEPLFADYARLIERGHVGEVQSYCVKNTENQTFSLQIVFPVGEMSLRTLPLAASYLSFVGTQQHSADQISAEFYRMACNFSMRCSDTETTFSLSGLSENFEAAFSLMMELLRGALPDEEVFQKLVANQIQAMEDAKHSQDKVLSALRIYGEYGVGLVDYSLKPDDLRALDGRIILSDLDKVFEYCPQIRYYGPLRASKVGKVFKKYYPQFSRFCPAPDLALFEKREVETPEVLFVPYDAKQSRLVTYSRGPLFNPAILPTATLYNAYFSGGMQAIVFQEMREKRSLAYTAKSSFILPNDTADYAYNYSFIGTQNDKVVDAWMAFNELFDNMPESEHSFQIAKESVKMSIATDRITKGRILSSYFHNLKRGFDYDYRSDIYRAVDHLTLEDVVDFNHRFIQNQPKVYMILARKCEVDLQLLQDKFGKVKQLELKDIFGY